jgi:hypothetical protein
LLCSSALAESIKSNPESYLTLLFSNGSCLQTIGPLHVYRGLASVDFHYYARLLRPDLYDRSGLSAVMTEVPENLVILDAFTEVPAIGHRGKRLYCCSSSFTATALDPAALSSSFDVEEAKGSMRFRLKGSDPPFALADLYWNPAGDEAFIYSKNWDDYQRIVAAVAAHLDAPSEPQMVCTQNMEVIAKNLLGVQPPVLAWQAPFEPPPASPQEEESTRRINALLQDLADGEIEEMLKSQARSMAIDVPGGLTGVPALPPSGRMYLQADLHSCKLFRFRTGDEAQRFFKDLAAGVEALRPKSRVSRTRTMLTLATLPTVLEEIDDPPGEDPSHTVIKYSMYLLCRAGSEYHSTADYATEILRLFWQVLVPSRERADFRRFTRQYAIWCRQTLVRTGLAEENGQEKSGRPGAPFSMRTAPFFKAWVRLGKTS